MIIVGLSLVALIGVTAFALDFGRMYLFRSQVHISSDAAALAAANELARANYGGAATAGVNAGLADSVDLHAPTINTATVVPCTWNFATSSLVAGSCGGSWSTAGKNAAQATSSYNASFTFGRIFGITTRSRTATSVAAVGGATTTSCVRPITLPYQSLLDFLFGAGAQSAATYTLTATDIANLAAKSVSNWISLPLVNGVELPPIEFANGTTNNNTFGNSAPAYQNAISYSCDALDTWLAGLATPYVGVGDWLRDNNGYKTSASSYIALLCTNGTSPSSPGTNKDFDCIPPLPIIKVAVWDVNGSPPHAPCPGGKCYRVKYLAALAVKGYEKSGKNMTGYFTAMVSNGRFSGTPGPIKRIGLVK